MATYTVPRGAGVPVVCTSSPSDPNPANFKYRFATPIDNSKGDLMVSLVQCTFTHHIDNVTRREGNTEFVFSRVSNPDPDSSTDWEQIDIPEGMYSLKQFNAYLTTTFNEYGYCDVDQDTGYVVPPIAVEENSALGKVVVTLKKGWSLSLLPTRGKSMHQFLGFEPQILSNNSNDAYKSINGTLVPDINRGRMSYNIHCNIIAGHGFSSGGESDVIGSITPTVGINDVVVYRNDAAIKIPISSACRQIREIHFRFTDQYNRDVTITGDPTVIVLSLQPGGD